MNKPKDTIEELAQIYFDGKNDWVHEQCQRIPANKLYSFFKHQLSESDKDEIIELLFAYLDSEDDIPFRTMDFMGILYNYLTREDLEKLLSI